MTTRMLMMGLTLAAVGAGCGPKIEPVGPTPAPTVTPAVAPTAVPRGAPAPSVATPTDRTPPELPPPRDPALVGVGLPGLDICEKNEDGTLKNPVAKGSYQGILRNAECDQQKFITMARVRGALGVACNYCHVPLKDDPSKEDFPVQTERKLAANWMCAIFIQGLQRRDGQPMTCASCHTDGAGKPVAKILGNPRDPAAAQEWMNQVMTAKFVEHGGKRLKCKTCHGGMAPGRPGWQTHVIGRLTRTEQGIARLPDQNP